MGGGQSRVERPAPVRRRLLWVISVRAVAAAGLFGTAILIRPADPAGTGDAPYFLLIAVTFALTGIYASTIRYVERHPWLIDLQFGADILMVSALVQLSGGVGSYFPSLYGLPIVGAGTLQGRRGGLATAAASAFCYAGVVLGQYAGMFPPVPGLPALPAAQEALYRVVMNGAGFFAIGGLTGSLAEGWRAADRQLASASSAIADLQALTRHIMDSLPGGVLTTDERGRILAANPAAASITGRNLNEMLGADVTQVLQVGDRLGGAPAGARKLEFEFVKPTGQRILLGLGAVPLSGDHPTRGHVYTFQDITSEKRRAVEAQRQKRLAAVGEMAAGIAHEIRNPLASMTGSMQLLRAELSLSGEQAQLMDIVLRESARLNETIRTFLAYARPQRGTKTRVDVGRIVDDTATLIRHSVECRHGHNVRVEGGPASAVCEGDEAQLRQVVWNLASNALRAMPHGGTLTFRVGHVLGPLVELSVEDTGVGMTPEQQERLFQPFHSGFPQGTGLGLATVHRIVADHGGAIDVRSTVGHGTVIHVRLPSLQEGDSDAPLAPVAVPVAQPAA
jgi:two-component system sensor histidine kinase PilS (NtrC family)